MEIKEIEVGDGSRIFGVVDKDQCFIVWLEDEDGRSLSQGLSQAQIENLQKDIEKNGKPIIQVS